LTEIKYLNVAPYMGTGYSLYAVWKWGCREDTNSVLGADKERECRAENALRNAGIAD